MGGRQQRPAAALLSASEASLVLQAQDRMQNVSPALASSVLKSSAPSGRIFAITTHYASRYAKSGAIAR